MMGIIRMAMLAALLTSGAALKASAAGPVNQAGPADDANLVIYRANAQPTAWAATVKIDGQKVAALTNRQFTALRVPPGAHKVTLSWPLISGQGGAKLDVTVNNGERHYLEVTGISQFAGMLLGTMYFNTGSGIAEAKPEYAEAVLKTCCTFKAGR
jgi:Protein of unknown function (DUF2846)